MLEKFSLATPARVVVVTKVLYRVAID